MDYGYTTTYGANGAAGGGGFMVGSQGGESGGAKRGYGKDTLRPVTIKQLLEANHTHPDAEFYLIDDAEATQVSFVGQIRNVSDQTTNTTYKMDDGTGTIEVKAWKDAEAHNNPDDLVYQRQAQLKEQAYAHVWGRLKSFNNKRHVAASIIRPIADFNEVHCHLLEATAVHLHFTRGPPEDIKQNSATNSTSNEQQGHGMNGADTGKLAMASANARKVFKCIKDLPKVNEGIHMTDIAARIGLDVDAVARGGEELTNLGLIYTTVDDHTWAILEL